MWYNNILETIGNTPLVKLNNITKEIPATVLAKIETTNPGNSIKDRMAVKMIEEAEKIRIFTMQYLLTTINDIHSLISFFFANYSIIPLRFDNLLFS